MNTPLIHDTKFENPWGAPFYQVPPWRWFTLFTLAFFSLLFILSGFVEFNCFTLPVAGIQHTWPQFAYSPQWWMYGFGFAVLGPRKGSLVYAIMLVLSLFFPVFASGGGLGFISRPAFVYLLAALFVLNLVAFQWQRRLSKWQQQSDIEKMPLWRRLLSALQLSLLGIGLLHGVSVLGLAGLVLLQAMPVYEAKQYFVFHSLLPLPYDTLGLAFVLWGTPLWRSLLRMLLY